MCTQTEKRVITQFNRIMIAVAGISGLLMDGFQGGDTFCTLSMLFWLWQSECKVLEEKLLDQCKRVKARRAVSHS